MKNYKKGNYTLRVENGRYTEIFTTYKLFVLRIMA